PAHLRAHLRQRHDAARHHPAPPRRAVAGPEPLHGQPRPRDVVPPGLPGRRVAPVRAGHALRVRWPGPRPRIDLHPGRAPRRHRRAGGPHPRGPAVSAPRRCLLVLLAAGLVAACTGTRDDDEDRTTTTSSSTTTEAPAVDDAPAVEATLDDAAVAVQEIARLEDPVGFAARPSSPNLYVIEKSGRVR